MTMDLINLSPQYSPGCDVAKDVWSGKEVSYKHLKVFGCRAFAHVPDLERSKLDGKTKECIFLDYSHDSFGYRLWDPLKKRVFRSRDVIFYEDQNVRDLQKESRSDDSIEEGEDIDLVVPQIPHGDGGGTEEEREHEEMPRENCSTSTEQEDVEEIPLESELQRLSRRHQPSRRYPIDEYVMLTNCGELECYQEEVECEHKEEWLAAMRDEMNSLQVNHTYDLVSLPKGRKALKCKWVFKLKTQENSSKPKYKARLIIKGFGQKKGIDFDEIFAPVVKISSIRVTLGMAACIDLEVE